MCLNPRELDQNIYFVGTYPTSFPEGRLYMELTLIWMWETFCKILSIPHDTGLHLRARIMCRAHTIGRAHCVSFQERIYPTIDPKMDPAFDQMLRYRCPLQKNSSTEPVHFTYFRNDEQSPMLFDNHYVTTWTWWPSKACSTSTPRFSGVREPRLTCSPSPKTMPCGTKDSPRPSPSWVNINHSRARKARFARSAHLWIDYSSSANYTIAFSSTSQSNTRRPLCKDQSSLRY